MRVCVRALVLTSPAGCTALLDRGCVLSATSSDWRAATKPVGWVLLTRAVGCVRAAWSSLAVTKPGGSAAINLGGGGSRIGDRANGPRCTCHALHPLDAATSNSRNKPPGDSQTAHQISATVRSSSSAQQVEWSTGQSKQRAGRVRGGLVVRRARRSK